MAPLAPTEGAPTSEKLPPNTFLREMEKGQNVENSSHIEEQRTQKYRQQSM
jgi:hypothetical protein